MFKEFDNHFNQLKIERDILKFWDEHQIFKKSIEQRDPVKSFVFYEGPPTANGAPGIHHIISRTIKDLVCRYKTMTGHRVERKAGWDTHGLPVEIEVEKQLRLTGREQILKYGIAQFNQKCKENVFRYKKEWDEVTRKIGYWIDLEHPYITYENSYIETVWWIIKELWKKDLIYQDFKVLPYCPRCETPLSSHEVAQGYREVEDPSLYVKIPLKAESNTYFLIWTTTPWTLISNLALALNPDMDYVKVLHQGQKLILANQRVSVLTGRFEILATFKGEQLANIEYEPLFSFIPPSKKAHFTIPDDFVTPEEGTGIVPIAPAFGEDDYQIAQKYGLPIIYPIDNCGRFVEEITDFKGIFVKDANPAIINYLESREFVYLNQKISHSYPHCWRCDAPLIYCIRNSWYLRTSAIKNQLVDANSKIKWYPLEVGVGRFGEWLKNSVDWSLSRDRFWGTPLNIWVCEHCGEKDCVGSLKELKQRASITNDLDLHKPYIDEVTYHCTRCNGVMKRVPEVIDCWFDSGAMPYAQWHYPFERRDELDQIFPADFIAEGVDQTRGWFYSLLVLAVTLFGRSSYKSCLAIELILDKEGQKMHKARGNIINPFEMIDKYGADPLRWYLLTASPPWLPTRFDEEGVGEVMRKFWGTLTNIYSFFALYANIDKFNGIKPPLPMNKRRPIDRWIISRLNGLVETIDKCLNQYEFNRSARSISDFVIADLSNWYVRRCRRRFWKTKPNDNNNEILTQDKLAAYQTLHHVLITVAQILAPFTPFLAEELYQNLKIDRIHGEESVHLCFYPTITDQQFQYRNKLLEQRMDRVRQVVNIGRSLRNKTVIKIRQPLNEIVLYSPNNQYQNHLKGIENLILEELNVKHIRYTSDLSELFVKKAVPIYQAIGPKFGKFVPQAAEKIRSLTEQDIEAVETQGVYDLVVNGKPVKITRDDIKVRLEPRRNFFVATTEDFVLAVNIERTESLIYEGLAREFVNRVQNMRKRAHFKVQDQILIYYQASESLHRAISTNQEYIKQETLAAELIPNLGENVFKTEWTINREKIVVGISKI